MATDLKREVDEQMALVVRLRTVLSRSADDVAARLAHLDNPLAKVEAMARLADIMVRVARCAADLQRLSGGQAGLESVDDLLKEDL